MNSYAESSSSDEDEKAEYQYAESEEVVGVLNDASSITDAHDNKKKRKKRKKGLTDPNKFKNKRDKLKKKIMKGVVDQVLPDIGAYDSKNIVSRDKSSSNGLFVQCCKLFGCFSSTLNEGVRYASLKSINRTIKKLQKSRKLEENINSYDEEGRTPLINAIMTRKQPDPDNPNFFPFAIIERLIDVGADLNAPDQLYGMTPLLCACSLKDEEAALILLTKGADAHMCDFKACIPIMVCAGLNLEATLTVILNRYFHP